MSKNIAELLPESLFARHLEMLKVGRRKVNCYMLDVKTGRWQYDFGYYYLERLKNMKNNGWSVKLGTQNNITPEDAPMLSEKECDLVNLFRALPEKTGNSIIKDMFELASQVHDVNGIK